MLMLIQAKIFPALTAKGLGGLATLPAQHLQTTSTPPLWTLGSVPR